MRLLVLLLAAAPAGAAVRARAPGPKVEAELRVPLTAAGHARLDAAFPASTSSRRRDSYMDYADLSTDEPRFLLRRADPPWKLRVKSVRAGEAKVQLSRRLDQRRVDQAGLSATATVTESRQTRLTGDQARGLESSLEPFFAALPGEGPLEALAAAAGAALEGLEWDGRDLARAAAGDSPAVLAPAARGGKRHRPVAVRLEDGTELPALLRRSSALDEAGRPVELYELEAEVEQRDLSALETLARRLLSALSALGLRPEEIGGPTPDAFLFTEGRLARKD